MEAFPHARQVLADKYGQLNSLLLERNKIDQTIIMVQQDIGKCVSSSSAYVADKEPAAPAATPIQEGSATVTATSKKKAAAKPKESKPKPAATPAPEPAATPAPEPAATPAPEPAATPAPVEVSMEMLRDEMSKLTSMGKGSDATKAIMAINNTPMNASPAQKEEMLKALQAIGGQTNG